MLTIVLQAVPGSIPGWVGPTIAISLAIVAFACVVMFVAIGLAAARLPARPGVGVRAAGRSSRRWWAACRDEGDAYLATSRRLRKRLRPAASTGSRSGAADLDALYEVVHDEVEDTALDFASVLRTARLEHGHHRKGARAGGGADDRRAGRRRRRRGGPGARHRAGRARTPGPRAPTSTWPRTSWPAPHLLPPTVADLLRAFPFDFLYGNIAADSSIAKNFAPVSRHCHHWHVGQEIHDLAPTDALRAFGLGLPVATSPPTPSRTTTSCPGSWRVTSSRSGLGHAYWESTVRDAPRRRVSPGTAKEVIQLDHTPADAHLDQIISPTIFSVRTNRRLFRGMVHLVETRSWQRAFRMARAHSRWDLPDEDVEQHMALSYEFVMEMLGDDRPLARRLDPGGGRSAEGRPAPPARGRKAAGLRGRHADPQARRARFRSAPEGGPLVLA